jgi:hypothetical protein
MGRLAKKLVEKPHFNWYGYPRSGVIQIEFARSNKSRHLGPNFGLVVPEGMPGV